MHPIRDSAIVDGAANSTCKAILAERESSRPLVSVIIVFLNEERFIYAAIESVFAQTYSNWELLLIDDGSTDRSTEMARRYARESLGRVSYLDHANHKTCGKTASRNLGIRHAKGEYIAFLDADDVWVPHKLQQQLEIFSLHPEAAMVYGVSQYWYSWTGKPEDQQRDFKHVLGVPPDTLLEPPTLISLFFLSQKAANPNPSNILVRREITEQVNGFDEAFRGIYDVYEDQAFYAKVCLKAPVFAANACWDKYRQHPNSSTALIRDKGKQYCARLFFLDWLTTYLSSQGVRDTEICQALRREIRRCRHPRLYRLRSPSPSLALTRAGHLTHLLARRVREWLRTKWKEAQRRLPTRWIHFRRLWQLEPLSRQFGYDRGNPIDRFYIEAFLSIHQTSIRGHVLEIADDNYTRRFGGESVTKSDVLNLLPGSPKTTLVADLTRAEHIPSATYDCIIITQTLQFVFDLHAAVRTLYRVLKPRGVLIATVPGISPISRYDMERWGHFWAFTSQSAKRLFSEVFRSEKIHIRSYGNVLSATAFLYGMATEELKREELEYFDPDYEVIIGVRAVKAEDS